MKRQKVGRKIIGLILVLLGLWFLAAQWFPSLRIWEPFDWSWPIFVIGGGLFLFLVGLLGDDPDVFIPASLVTGVGLLLYWQFETGNWASWAYVWTLIPGFIAFGIILAGLLRGNVKDVAKDAFLLLMISLFAFVIFAYFLGGSEWVGIAAALLFILAGLALLLRQFFLPKELKKQEENQDPEI